MGSAVSYRTAQGTPQNSWSPMGQKQTVFVSQFANTWKTDREMCAAIDSKNDSDVANFASGSSTQPWWVKPMPVATFMSMRMLIGVTAGTIDANLPNMKACAAVGFFRDPGESKGKTGGGPVFSPEIVGKIDATLLATAIPLTAAEKAKYLPTSAPAADWYWASDYTLELNVDWEKDAGIPASLTRDYRGSAYMFAFPNCVADFSSTSRTAVACGIVVAAL